MAGRMEEAAAELRRLSEGVGQVRGAAPELAAVRQRLSEMAGGGADEGLQRRLRSIEDAVREIAGGGAGGGAPAGGALERIGAVEERLSSLAEAAARSEEAAAEFRGRAAGLLEGLQAGGGAEGGAPAGGGALLRLAACESAIRMAAESKRGGAEELGEMAERAAEMAGLPGGAPQAARWAVARIIDCAGRWEVRFSDAFAVLSGALGRDRLGGLVRLPQVRDVYGTRAVDEIRGELGLP